MSKPRVIVVEDNAFAALDIQQTLEGWGLEVAAVFSLAEEAESYLIQQNIDLALLDINLWGEMTGIDLAERLQSRSIPVIFLTAQNDQATRAEAAITQPVAYVVKPFRDSDLLAAITKALGPAFKSVTE